MDLIYFIIDFILHIDVHLAELVAEYGVWVYAILFLILFCETGPGRHAVPAGRLAAVCRRGAGFAGNQRSPMCMSWWR
ncbi:DedA protein [Salmonella enterica subsp. enterica]|uniref:DedA protein n=1 Tax=Salmonella enterica I TaxID=59201 RepID=A0A447N6X4_SALET|nr:DedA protein [Salmonella enterica subsp. enterica]